MKNFKDTIIDAVENNKDIISNFSLESTYLLQLFKKMMSPTNKHRLFNKFPDGFFEDFRYTPYFAALENHSKVDLQFLSDKIEHPSNVIVFLNGMYSDDNTSIFSSGLRVNSLRNDISKYFDAEKVFFKYFNIYDSPLLVANNMLARTNISIEIEDKISEPIYIVNVVSEMDTSSYISQKKFIIAKENADARIIELYFMYPNNDLILGNATFFNLENNVNIDYSNLLFDVGNNSKNKIHILGNIVSILRKDVALNTRTISFGNEFCRNRELFFIRGENSEISADTFVFPDENKATDFKSRIIHTASKTTSKQTMKAIAKDNATASFYAKIEIEKNAVKSVSSQNSRAILLDEGASVDFAPELEINVDDVQSSHGVAIGDIDSDILFYFKSRGIDEIESKKLLIEAFYADIVNAIPTTDTMQEHIKKKIAEIS